MNAVLIISDGLEARIGTLTAEKEWFKAWRTISGDSEADSNLPQLEVLLSGVCEPKRFLSLVRDYIVIEDDGVGNLEKKMAGYHQFYAVETAVEETLRASKLQQDTNRDLVNQPTPNRTISGVSIGDRRIGVVWHTQGSGKSLTHGILCRSHYSRTCNGKPNCGGAYR